MAQSYSVSLDTIVREHNLAIVNRAVDYDRVQITTWEVSRPGLPLAGFYDYFDATRVQIIGKLEITYLMDMRPETRSRSIERFISSGIRFPHRRARHGYPARDALLGAAPSGDAAHYRALHERFYGKAYRESQPLARPAHHDARRADGSPRRGRR